MDVRPIDRLRHVVLTNVATRAGFVGKKAMTTQDIVRVNFTISPSAWSEIDKIKTEYDAKYPEKADVVMIAWGTTMFNDGTSSDGVVIGYYNTSERRFIEHGIQKINDREVIFFVTYEIANKFENRTICFEGSSGFYLI